MRINFRIFRSKLAKDSVIYTFSDVINMAIPFLLLPILARYLTPSDYGSLSAFTSITSGSSVIIGLSVSSSVNINYYKLSKKELSIYVSNVILISMLSFFITIVCLLIFQNYFVHLLSLSIKWILLAIIIAFASFIIVINTNLWIMEQKPILFGGFKISSTIVNFTLSLFFVIALAMSWEGRALGILVTSILFSLVSLALLFKRGFIKLKYNLDYIKDALQFGIPLIPYQLSGWIRNGGIIFLLIYLIGKNETGLYSVGAKFALIIYVLSMAFTKAWGPYLYRELSKDLDVLKKEKIVKVTYLSFILLLFLAAILTLLAPTIIQIVFPESYANSNDYVGYLVFGAAFQGMYLMVVKFIYFMKKTKYVAYITFTIGAINFLLAYLLIRMNGSIGAAQANTISFFLSFVVIWYYSNKVYKMPWNILKRKL